MNSEYYFENNTIKRTTIIELKYCEQNLMLLENSK